MCECGFHKIYNYYYFHSNRFLKWFQELQSVSRLKKYSANANTSTIKSTTGTIMCVDVCWDYPRGLYIDVVKDT